MKDELDLSHLEEIMPLVDDLDSGGISLSEFMEDGPVIRLSRSLSLKDKNHMQVVLNQFAEGESLDNIVASHQERLSKLETEREAQTELVRKNTTIVDKLAICDLSETGSRSNGYLVTALAGSDAIACCVIHGFIDGTIDNPNRQALGASFYANSFLDEENPYDLSKLATLLDATGGGHANACGCRVQPADKSREMLVETDKDYNLQKWLELWSKRDTLMRQ